MRRQPAPPSAAAIAIMAAALVVVIAIDSFDLPSTWVSVVAVVAVGAAAVLSLKDPLRWRGGSLPRVAWWSLARTVRHGLLLAALWAAVALTAWLRLALTEAGLIAWVTAVFTLVLSASHLASALALRRVQGRG